MPFIERSLTGGRFPFNVPLVGLDPATKRYTRLSDEVKLLYRSAAADALNEYSDEIARDSQIEVPKEDGELAASMLYPDNDPASRATAEDLDATISYNTIYADVQHEGVAVMVHRGQIIPGKEGFFERQGAPGAPIRIIVQWKAENYTIPGTKAHYLEDPLKAHIPRMEAFVGMKVREVFG